jgi:hypothetical protein
MARYHEGGHATMHYTFGHDIEEITVDPVVERAQVIARQKMFDVITGDVVPVRPVEYIMALLGGSIAQYIHKGQQWTLH